MALSPTNSFTPAGKGMAGQKRGNAKVLTAVQAKRRALRAQFGITDIRKATPEQVAAARKAGILPGSTGSAQYDRVLSRVAQNRGNVIGDPAVPAGTPHAVQQAAALGLTPIGGKRRRKGGPAGGRPQV